MKYNIQKRLFFTTLFSLLLFSFALAQDEEGKISEKIGWIRQIGMWWLFLFVFGVALIFTGIIVGKANWKIRKWLSILGLIIVFLGIFGAEIVYLTPYLFGNPVVEYKECKSLTMPGENPIYTLACMFVGFAPPSLEWQTLGAFIIFGVIAPIAMLTALFYEFTGFLTHKGVRNVMAFLSALVAYRFLLATLFIDLLGYGFAGLGILLFDYFFFMVIFRVMKGLWAGAAMIEEIIVETEMEKIADLTKKLRDAQSVLSTLSPTSPEYKYWKTKVDQLENELKELQGKAKLPTK